MKLKTKLTSVIIVIIVVLLAFWLGWWLSHTGHQHSDMPNQGKAIAKESGKPLYWVAPMNPKYRRDKPGKSPMGMDLVPVYDEPKIEGVIQISPAVENNIGVRTAVVKMQDFHQEIHSVGYVQPDENFIKDISVYTAGWIKDLKIKSTGETVKKNQLLFKLYSPAIVSAQQEYLLALKTKNSLLIKSGKEKLITLGVASKEISALERSHKTQRSISVYAPESGYITLLNVRDGMHIKPDSLVMKIANLSKVWVIVEVYENQSSLLKNDAAVKATFSAMPGKVFTGKVEYIYPELNAKTRTIRVRTQFNNDNELLRPKMYANIIIAVPSSGPVIAIPKESLIQMGDQTKVILALGNGRFKPISVHVGQENDHLVEILHGLKPGDKIVTSAQFLLDSESSLKSGLNRIDSSGTIDANNQKKSNQQHNH